MADVSDWLGAPPIVALPGNRLEPLEVPPLAVDVNLVSATTVRVAFRGELDLASARQARLVLAAAGSIGRREIELDVSALTFCDAIGLGVFVDAQRDCAERGGLLLLVDPAPAVRRVLALSGLDRLLTDWRT